MPYMIHQFTPFVEPQTEDPSSLQWSACVTGDPQRMIALFEETDDLTRRSGGEGHLGQAVTTDPSGLALELPAPPLSERCDSYQEQLAYLAGLELERAALGRDVAALEEAA